MGGDGAWRGGRPQDPPAPQEEVSQYSLPGLPSQQKLAIIIQPSMPGPCEREVETSFQTELDIF